MVSRKKWVTTLTALITVLLLSACGSSVENKVLGSWKAVTGGKSTGYLEINEDRYTIRQESDENPMTVEYILTETEDDKFIMEAVNPENGLLEFLFEGYFENKNKIAIVGDPGDAEGESGLIRVNSVAKEMEKDKKRLAEQDEREAAEDAKLQEEKNKELAKEKEEKLKGEAAEKATARVTEKAAKPNFYRQKADNLDAGIITEAKKIMAQDMPNGFYGQYYHEWDDLLNEVWGVLKSSMTETEFERLKIEQVEWIAKKEAAFAEISDEVASERQRGMDYLAFETKDRTYYLIENHLE